MREYQHKQIVRTLLYSPITIVVLFLIIILSLRSIVDLNNKRITSMRLRDEAIAKQIEVQGQLAKADARRKAIETDRGFEEYVRTTYPVAKRGEGVIVVYDEPGSPVTPVREHMNIWERLLIFFKPFLLRF